MPRHSVSDDIVAAARRVIEETQEIDRDIFALEQRIATRKATVSRLALLVDVNLDVVMNGGDPIAIEEAVLLDVYLAGDEGATRPHLRAAMRHRYGPHVGTLHLDSALQGLLDRSRIVESDGLFFPPRRRRDTTGASSRPATLKERVMAILEEHGGPLKTAEISRIFAREGVTHSVHVLSPILTRLVRDGRVRHEGKHYSVVPIKEAADKLVNSHPETEDLKKSSFIRRFPHIWPFCCIGRLSPIQKLDAQPAPQQRSSANVQSCP